MANKKNKFEETFLKLEEENEINLQEENNKQQNAITSEEVKINEELKIDNNTVTKIITIKNDEISEEMIMQKMQEAINTIKNKASKIEQIIQYENSRRFRVLNKKKSYSDKYRGVTLSIRPEILEMINNLKDVLGMDKYEVIETLLLNGIKYSKFDE